MTIKFDGIDGFPPRNVQSVLCFTEKDAHLQVSPNFKAGEFRCKDGGPVWFVHWGLLVALESVRHTLGDVPLSINSGWRSFHHNRNVGGAASSRHLIGQAADFTAAGIAPSRVQMLLSPWEGGMGSYSTFTHIDIGPKRRWNG